MVCAVLLKETVRPTTSEDDNFVAVVLLVVVVVRVLIRLVVIFVLDLVVVVDTLTGGHRFTCSFWSESPRPTSARPGARPGGPHRYGGTGRRPDAPCAPAPDRPGPPAGLYLARLRSRSSSPPREARNGRPEPTPR
jgi:hypothetical protein